MSEFKGTKGNWYVPNMIPYKINCDGKEIAQANISNNHVKANAILISKAPEMLSLLEWIVENVEINDSTATGMINNLIKEATTL